MYGDRRSSEFIIGLHIFLDVAKANKRDGFIRCPCSLCKNSKNYSSSDRLHSHLLQYGFMPGYNCWTKHGEKGVRMEDNEEEEDDDTYPMFPEHGGTSMGEDEAEEEAFVDEPDDDLGRAILDAQINCESENERLKLERMLEDQKNCYTQIAKMAGKSWIPHWNCCNGRRRMVYLTRDLKSC